eukprot:1547999-Rhodomonas_salina.1
MDQPNVTLNSLRVRRERKEDHALWPPCAQLDGSTFQRLLSVSTVQRSNGHSPRALRNST